MNASPQTLLMCAPDHFDVSYVINPWMAQGIGHSDHDLARRQWQGLHDALAAHAPVKRVRGEPGLPDMVFTANAGLVYRHQVVVSRFLAPERQGEEAFFRAWFEGAGFTVVDWPADVSFEGAGDALFDRGQPLLWAGHGFRSAAAAAPLLEQRLGCRTLSLRLVDPRFYHLDTCFCPLSDGYLMYLPDAFDAASLRLIESEVPEGRRIAVSIDDGLGYACNAVELDHHIFFNSASPSLQQRLREAGFTPYVLPLSEYLKSGGAAKCLTLKLVEP